MRTGSQVLVFPAWQDNPFLNLLQLSAASRGYEFLSATTWPSLQQQMNRLQAGDVMHLHWTSPILQSLSSEGDARARLDEMRRALTQLTTRGVHIVWTLHNRLPHETHFRELEVELYRAISDAADAIHIMNPQTADVVADIVQLDPDKLRVIPHPSYAGVYDSGADRVSARDSFELGHSDHAALFLGQIRPYKGVDVLVEAAGRAKRDLVLMLAGAVKDMQPEEFLESLPDDLRTVTQFGFVPDAELARWFLAADVAVFPYRQILNSGSVHLAATFHVPVIIPGEPHLRHQFGGERWVQFFDTDRAADSIAELLSDDQLFADVTSEDFELFNNPISPWKVAQQYSTMLEGLPRPVQLAVSL